MCRIDIIEYSYVLCIDIVGYIDIRSDLEMGIRMKNESPCPASMTILILSLLLVVLGFVVVVVVVMLPVVLFELLCVVPEI